MTRTRGLLIGGGTLVMLYALVSAVVTGEVNLIGVPVFLVAMLVLHDGVFLPAVVGVGALVHRFVPRRWRPPVHWAGIVSLAVAVVAMPLILGFGRSADNASLLPRSYGWGTLVILILVWLVTFAIRKGLARRRPVIVE
jgi:uncharacterized BrkB/YihY/UPF0761 family membrane protein